MKIRVRLYSILSKGNYLAIEDAEFPRSLVVTPEVGELNLKMGVEVVDLMEAARVLRERD